jgi:hypothetical protein
MSRGAYGFCIPWSEPLSLTQYKRVGGATDVGSLRATSTQRPPCEMFLADIAKPEVPK